MLSGPAAEHKTVSDAAPKACVAPHAWRGYTLLVLLAINALNFYDRQILGAVAEPIKKEWRLSDQEIGWLSIAFILLYAIAGVPLGRLVDRTSRKRVLAGGVILWSAMTALSGLARGTWSLFAARLGVGVGEASCAPAATSLLGDLYPKESRARSMAVFMLGLPIGLGLSFAVSGAVAQHFGWRSAFFVPAVPGLLLVLAALTLAEPVRLFTSADRSLGHVQAFRRILATPTMYWIALSGAIHNFNLYAISTFLSPLLIRYHGVSIARAGQISGLVYGVCGGVGMLAGGWLSDCWARHRIGGRLEAAAAAVLLATFCLWLALGAAPGAVAAFTLFMLGACFLFYIYYSSVYASIQDLFAPELRGTAMAVYFLAMYLCGGAFGPVIVGWLSDSFARAAAAAGTGVIGPEHQTIGLHQALEIIPWLGIALTVVLFIGSRTMIREQEHMTSLSPAPCDTPTPIAD
jgi:MFS family permease